MLAKATPHMEWWHRDHLFLFFGKSDHDQAIIGDHDQAIITDHGRAIMTDHDGQEYPINPIKKIITDNNNNKEPPCFIN